MMVWGYIISASSETGFLALKPFPFTIHDEECIFSSLQMNTVLHCNWDTVVHGGKTDTQFQPFNFSFNCMMTKVLKSTPCIWNVTFLCVSSGHVCLHFISSAYTILRWREEAKLIIRTICVIYALCKHSYYSYWWMFCTVAVLVLILHCYFTYVCNWYNAKLPSFCIARKKSYFICKNMPSY